MNFALITENYFTSCTSFVAVDNREPFYSTNHYCPTSANNAIVWHDQDGGQTSNVGPIADNGDLSVSAEFAAHLMSFDPYGIEVYPSTLTLSNGTLENRYLLAINNLIDVLDEEKSEIEISPKSGDLLIHELYLSASKLSAIPLEKRVVFRVKGAETAIFFCEEFFDVINTKPSFAKLRKTKISTADVTPKF